MAQPNRSLIPAPTNDQLQRLLDKIINRILKLLTRLGHLIKEEGITYLARTDSIDPQDVLTPLQAASSTYRIAMGPRAGRKVLSLQHAPRRVVSVTQQLCANAHGPSAGSGQALACMRGCAVMPINAVSLNNCAATSRARLLFTIGQ